MIRIPTVSSYAWKYYGINWYQIDAPRHFYLHSVKSLKILAEKCGFYIDQIKYDSGPLQFSISENYKQDIPLYGNDPHIQFSPEEIKSFEKKAEELNAQNQGDQATFYLKKIR